MRTALEVVEGGLVRGDHAGPGPTLDAHIADRHSGLHRELLDGPSTVLDDVPLGPVGADLGDDGQDDVLGPAARGQVPVNGDAHRLEGGDGQGLGGQDVLDLGGTDTEGEGPEGAVSGGVGVATDHRHAGLGQAQLRTDGVDDPLVGVSQGVQPHPELGAVGAQGLDLSAAGDVGDRQVDVHSGRVVVLGGDRQVGTTHRAPGQTQPLEGLGAGDLVDQVKVDVQQVGGAVATLGHHMIAPDLLSESHSHRLHPLSNSVPDPPALSSTQRRH